jgi:hypothetical protein
VIWGVMPKVNLKTHFKKFMLTLRLYCHVFSVGMYRVIPLPVFYMASKLYRLST